MKSVYSLSLRPVTIIYILRKHPIQYRWGQAGTLKSFTIEGTYASRKKCREAAQLLNSRTIKYYYTVGVVTLESKNELN